VLKLSAPETVSGDTIKLALNVGPVPVRFKADGLFGEMTQRDPEFGAQLDPATVAHLIGLATDELHAAAAPQVVSTGTAFAIVALRSHHSLARLKVDQEKATKFLREHGGRWFYVLGPTGGDNPAWRARMQFNGGEDPATGSAAGCAISYLVRYGLVAPGSQIHVRQGVEIGRASDLFLAADLVSGKVGDVRVGGSTVRVAKGQLFLP
jgi:trans-2,3-dihydro-3-hydroxyanthranilate isomerase